MSLRDDEDASTSTLTALLHARAQAQSAAPALIDRDRTLAYTDIESLSLRLAAGLAQMGVCAGDRIALWLPNLPA